MNTTRELFTENGMSMNAWICGIAIGAIARLCLDVKGCAVTSLAFFWGYLLVLAAACLLRHRLQTRGSGSSYCALTWVASLLIGLLAVIWLFTQPADLDRADAILQLLQRAPRHFMTTDQRRTAWTSSYLARLLGTGWEHSAQQVNQSIKMIIATYPDEAQGWFDALILGNMTPLGMNLKNAYKYLGLFHLLVLSGKQVSILGKMLRLLLRGPLHVLYVLRLTHAVSWVGGDMVVKLLVGLLLLFYGSVVGFPPACQRAVIAYWVAHMVPYFVGRLTLARKLRISFMAQALLFPATLLTSSSLLSWGAYLIVLGYAYAGSHATFVARLLLALELQAALAIFMLSLVGEVSLFAIIANLLAAQLFGIIMAGCFAVILLQLFAGPSLLLPYLSSLPIWFNNLIMGSAHWLIEARTSGVFKMSTHDTFTRTLVFAAAALLILNSLRQISAHAPAPAAAAVLNRQD